MSLYNKTYVVNPYIYYGGPVKRGHCKYILENDIVLRDKLPTTHQSQLKGYYTVLI